MIHRPTWKQRLRHWRIRRQLKKLDRELYRYVLKRSDYPDFKIVSRIRQESQPLQNEYDLFQTQELKRQAEKYCVDIPNDVPEWWRTVTTWSLSGIEPFDLPLSVLTERGQRHARKLLSEERRRVRKARVEILVPLLSLVVAILALIVSVLLSAKS